MDNNTFGSRILEKRTEKGLSQKELASALGKEEDAAGEAVVYISFLRKKTDLPGKERLIFTARGRGYYIKND